MKSLIKKCKNCNIYTIRNICMNCGGQTVDAIPPRYSPEDRYGKYRRRLKKVVEEWTE